MLQGIDEIFTSNSDGLIAMLNDAITSSFLADYRAALRVASADLERYEACGNIRMACIMRDNVSFYKGRIAELEQQLGGQS